MVRVLTKVATGDKVTTIIDMIVEEYKESIVEQNIPYELISNYYNGELQLETEVIELQKRLYLLETGVRGYDTYDSGVFVAYCEEQALEIATKKSADFKNASVTYIGNPTKDLKVGAVCLSFNAG